MTPRRLARIVTVIFFLALLATPIAMKRLAAWREVGKSKLEASQALARYGFYFQEVAHASGITSFIKRRHWITNSITSCRKLRRWELVLRLLISIEMVGRTSI